MHNNTARALVVDHSGNVIVTGMSAFPLSASDSIGSVYITGETTRAVTWVDYGTAKFTQEPIPTTTTTTSTTTTLPQDGDSSDDDSTNAGTDDSTGDADDQHSDDEQNASDNGTVRGGGCGGCGF